MAYYIYTYPRVAMIGRDAMNRNHKFENYEADAAEDSIRDTPRPSFLKITSGGQIYAIFFRRDRNTSINNSQQVDYWIRDSEIRVCFITERRFVYRRQDWNSTLKEYRREKVWIAAIDHFKSCLLPTGEEVRVYDRLQLWGKILPNYPSEESSHFVRGSRVKSKHGVETNARDETHSRCAHCSAMILGVDFTMSDGARRFAPTRARNEITSSIEIPARNQRDETILDFNPRVTNEPIIT